MTVTRDDTLRLVAARVDEVLDELQRTWEEVAGRGADVLGERDLPWLVRTANGGGKRLRPEMVHWGWVAAGAPEDAHGDVVDLGAAIELLHLFALIHDDVMDRSEMRRGQVTSHALARDTHRAAGAHGDPVAFGDAIAVLAGDLVLAEAGHLVAPLPSNVRASWRLMMVELVLGQRRDLTGAASGRRDLHHALEVARLKSGAYTVTGPLRMGAQLGGADVQLLDALAGYSWHAGEAFGLRDDVLGLWGDPARTGKSVEDDLATGKATVLLALAEPRLGSRGRGLLARTGDGTLGPEELQELRDEMAACGVRDLVEDMIADEVEQACAALVDARITGEGLDGLVDVVRRMAWRQA